MRSGDYAFEPMGDVDARENAAWRYAPPYDFYDSESAPDDLAELLTPLRRENSYFSVRDEEGALVGFFQFERAGGTVDVVLGLRSDLTDEGRGIGFVISGLEFARRCFDPRGFTLSGATFNGRAIRVYEHAGFRRVKTYLHRTNGGEHEFLSIAREA